MNPSVLLALLLTSPAVMAADPTPVPATSEPAAPRPPAETRASPAGKDSPTDAPGARDTSGKNSTKATSKAPAGSGAPPTAPGTQKVLVTGGRLSDIEQRRQSTAGKLVYGREELDRNGDSTLGEVLKRLPGVTLGGPPGRGGGVRFRGLGNGYTQILLNGERAPRGFSIESLAPDQVERVEIIRGPVAEYSTQAIAGTINIILREGYAQKETQLRFSDGFEHGRHTPNVSITHPGKSGNLSYTLSGSLSESHSADAGVVENREYAPTVPSLPTTPPLPLPNAAPPLLQNQQVASESANRNRGLHFTPRFSWRWDNGDTLVLQPLLVSNRSDQTGQVVLTERIAPPPNPAEPAYATASTRNKNSTLVLRTFGNWQTRLAESARLNLKFGLGHVKTESNTVRLQFASSGQLQNTILDNNDVSDDSANIGLKYTAPLEKWLGNGHLLATGLDLEAGKRTQNRHATNNGVADFAASGDELIATTRRLALFVQDEWEISEKWSTNLGLRWEGIRTNSERGQTSQTGSNTPNGGSVRNFSGVWSPVLHHVWRLPGQSKDQIRLGLTRSYRAPTLNDLVALPSLSRLNSATRPDSTGNPALRPELATGIDAGFEHYLSRGGVLSVNLFRRNITDLIRRTTTLENGRFVSRPTNFDKANTSGVELEAKFQLAELMENAPQLDVRVNLSRFWSRVKSVPGPDNRIDSQPNFTGNLGLDYRLPQSKLTKLTIGGNYNWTPPYSLQTSPTEHSDSGNKRQLDLYGLWKFSAGTQLRLFANNVLHRDAESASLVQSAAGLQTAHSTSRTYATYGVRFEIKI